MKSNRQPDRAMQSYFQVYVKGVIVACIVALLLFAILALLITYTNISESIIPAGILAILSISGLISGVYVGANLKTKGWLNGILIGFIFIGFIFLIGCILNKEILFELSFLYKLIIGIVAGGIGGMIGVNLK